MAAPVLSCSRRYGSVGHPFRRRLSLQQLGNGFAAGKDGKGPAGVIGELLLRIDAEALVDRGQEIGRLQRPGSWPVELLWGVWENHV